MKNIVLFGGNFDPVHDGHINMSIAASKLLDADVIFIPAKVSIWKNKAAPIDDRIAVLNAALNARLPEDIKSRFSVSRYEGDLKSDENYTIDTVKHFKELYPGDSLFLLIGTDQVNRFHDWRSAEELSRLSRIVFFSRPDHELDKTNVEKYNMLALEGELIDESSTNIRELKSMKIPMEAVEVILEKNLYFTPKLKKYLSEHRYNHSVSVARTAYKIAMSNHVKNIWKIVLASLLHDVAKELDPKRTLEIMNKDYPEYINYHPAMYHQFVGERVVREDFGVTDEEILDAIKYHTTGKQDMTVTGIIVYAADKIEPTRGLFSQKLIKAMCEGLESGFSTVLIDNRKFYIDHHVDYENPLTLACMKQYIKE